MAGTKRTRTGQIKPQNDTQQPTTDATMTEPTPPCAQPQLPSSKPPSTQLPTANEPGPKKQKLSATKPQSSEKPTSQHTTNPHSTNRRKRQKLPDNVTISKRPLLHPAIPTPFSTSTSPKVLYITASTPYIPSLKRIRKLLSEITKRSKQSSAAKARGYKGAKRGYGEANGRLEARDVERQIAEGARQNSGGGAGGAGGAGKGEEVYLKATGRAIPRALEIGVYFQGEEDCRVRVEMGSVSAVDDIEVRSRCAKDGEEDGGAKEDVEEEDIPETRIRMLSSVTVSVGLK